jgi:hypothetical protein
MADSEHLEIIEQGVEFWNQWRSKNHDVRPDLEGAKLRGFDLAGVDFARTILHGAKLGNAKLYRASFRDAELQSTSLLETDCRSADFQCADLRGTDLRQANLSTASLMEAKLRNTVFGGTNLHNASVESCIHIGRSIIDHDTLVRSWPLPLKFLRGCGLPENYINYFPSLLNQPVQFYSCFISYSTNDQEVADRLHADLQNRGVRCWFAPHDLRAGRKLHEQIDEAIRLYDRLLLILSEHSMGSEWVKTEIAHARQKEINERRQVLFPISVVPFAQIREWRNFDADTGKDSAREIREYFIPDFSNWKDPSSYEMAFARLITDLKAERNQSPPATQDLP